MKTTNAVLTLLLAAGMLGCGRQQPARHIVILPDVSGSIERGSLEQAFTTIDEMVGHLHRGDRIAIIPILGDAQAEASGRIIRFEVPTERRAYDADLRDFRRKLGTSLAEMRANALAHPGSKTDILGSVELAAQEFEGMPGKSIRMLLVLSDFIQEDRQLDFRKDGRLGSLTTARDFAAKLLKTSPVNFLSTRVYLGLMRSREFAEMSQERRNAIQRFWVAYFQSGGGRAKFVSDGPGLVLMNLSTD